MRRVANFGRALVALGVWAAASVDAAAAAERAAAHTLLEASAPAAGDTVAVVPEALVLTFGGLVEESGAALRLLGPSGRRWTLEASRVEGSVRALTSPLPALPPGGYRLEWRVISGDGHPISGDFVFFVGGGGGAEGASLGAPPPPSTEGHEGHEGHGPAGGAPAVGLAASRAAADAAALLLAGLLFFGAFGAATPSTRTALATKALAVAAPLLVASYAWLWTETVSEVAAGAPERLRALTDLFTGRALLAELVLWSLVPWALLLARRVKLAALFATLALGAGAFAGHAASYTPGLAIPANALHQLAAAVWVGGLLFLVTEARATSFADSARRVSAAALVAVVAIVASGVLQSWLIVGSLGQLFATPYGLLLLAKSVGLLALVGLGAYHRFRWLPRVLADGGSTRASATVGVELALAAGVVVLAAVLSHVPPNP